MSQKKKDELKGEEEVVVDIRPYLSAIIFEAYNAPEMGIRVIRNYGRPNMSSELVQPSIEQIRAAVEIIFVNEYRNNPSVNDPDPKKQELAFIVMGIQRYINQSWAE